MAQHDGLGENDLHLRFARRGPLQWEFIPSPGKFRQPMVVNKSKYGNVYTQGVFVDSAGRSISPVEVAGLIDQHGYRAMDILEGNFVIAVDDKRDGVWCATDTSATLPLYYKLTRDELLISSRSENMRIKSASDLDLGGVIAVLNSGYPWGELTLLKDWKALRPGHLVRIDDYDRSSITSYFDPEADETVQGFQSPQELIDAVDTGLRSIASRYKNILLPLSGGVDSRLIAVRCHALGIPFEAITFVANVPDGDDYDIATRLVKIFGTRHYRWEWNPSVPNCIQNFKDLCIATGGMNDAYTSYPDGMKYFGEVASKYDCIMRGDHPFGIGEYADTVFSSAFLVGMNFTDDLNWALKHTYQNTTNMRSVFEGQEGIRVDLTGPPANAWRHVSFRKTRGPRFLLPIGQLQSQHTEVTYPFLTKEIVERMSRTESRLRDSKLIARQALTLCSPPEIEKIPLSNQPTWKNTEPLLNLPSEVTHEMMRQVGESNILSEVVDDAVILGGYHAFLQAQGANHGKRSLISNLKQIVKKSLPKGIVAAYQKTSRQHVKTPSHMLFKRYYAMKVFINSIS